MKPFVHINEPCNANWDRMQQKGEGRHCGSCDKVVFDLSTMNDEQLISFLRNRKGNECGRFRAGQVAAPKFSGKFKFRIAAFFTLMLARFFTSEATAQEDPKFLNDDTTGPFLENNIHADSVIFHIKGTVISKKTGSPLSYVSVIVEVNGEPVGASAYSDRDGNFELNVPAKRTGDKISLTFSKRHCRELKVRNYTPSVKPLKVKMHVTRRKRHHGKYVMGKF